MSSTCALCLTVCAGLVVVFNPALTKYVLPEAGLVSALGLVLVAVGKSGSTLIAEHLPESVVDNLSLIGIAMVGSCFGAVANICLDRRANRFDSPADFVMRGIGGFIVGVVVTPLFLHLACYVTDDLLPYRVDIVFGVSAVCAMFHKPIHNSVSRSFKEFLPSLLRRIWRGITTPAEPTEKKRKPHKEGPTGDVE